MSRVVIVSILVALLLLGSSCTSLTPATPEPTIRTSVASPGTSQAATPIPATPGLAIPSPLASPASSRTPTQIPATEMPSNPTPTATRLPTATPDPCEGSTASGAAKSFTFEEIVPCLDSPERILAFMRNNLRHGGGSWDHDIFGGNAYSAAGEVFARGVDDCDGLSEFAACVMHLNGFEAYNVGISILGPLGHNVAGFVMPDGQVFSLNNGQQIDGPFGDWEDLAHFYISNGYAEPDNVLWLFEPCLQKTVMGDAILDLPHKVLR